MRISLERWQLLHALTFTATWMIALGARQALLAGGPDNDWSPVAIERRAVESSNLASVGYHVDARVHEVEFRSGAVYRYRDVPRVVFTELMEAGAKGRNFAQNIRAHYAYRQMR